MHLSFTTAEWLGFFNRTCSAGTLNPRTYGPTAGPWLRTFSNPNGDSWRQYIIDVVGQTEDGDDLVSIKSYLEGGKALCEAYITPEKEDRCKGDFWAPIVHTGHRKPYTWRLVPVVGDESYQIIAESRGAGCLKYLGASKSCGIGNVTLFEKDDGSRRQRWVIRESKGAVVPSPPPPAKVRLGAPLINSAYPTGVNSGTATITPPPGATRCVLSHAGTDITFRPTYPSTTININELEPGVEDLLTVVCTSADGVTSPTSNEVLVTPPSPGRLQNTPVVEMINSDDVVATYNITYLPPPGDDCTPVSYKVTYTSADGQKTTITVPAAQPYGTAPTEVQLLNLDLGSSYSVVCVGICQAADVPTTSAPIKVSITTPEVAPPAVPGVLPSPPPPPIASPPPPRVRSPPPKPPLAAPVIEVAYPTGPTTGEVKFTPPADVTNCTVYVNKTPQSIVPAEYPTTTVEITDLIPGNKTFITVTAEADDGRVSGPSNEVSPLLLFFPVVVFFEILFLRSILSTHTFSSLRRCLSLLLKIKQVLLLTMLLCLANLTRTSLSLSTRQPKEIATLFNIILPTSLQAVNLDIILSMRLSHMGKHRQSSPPLLFLILYTP